MTESRPTPDPDDVPEASDAPPPERLTPGGARLRNRPEPEPEPELEPEPEPASEPEDAEAAPDAEAALPPIGRPSGIQLKKYYLGVVLLLAGVALGLYGFVDIWGGRGDETGGITMVTAAKVALGGALMMYGQNMVRAATNDPRARR